MTRSKSSGYQAWRFELARTRSNRVCSMEKRNVMKSGVLWHEVVSQVHKEKYSDVELDHMLADAGGMQLVRWPKQFDVIVTDNLFGDMLSDVAAMLTGSLGMLPSASLGAPDPVSGARKALYEPVHGSAPDIAGQGIANPIAMIASFAMCLRYSFNMVDEAGKIESAIAAVLDSGRRTPDYTYGWLLRRSRPVRWGMQILTNSRIRPAKSDSELQRLLAGLIGDWRLERHISDGSRFSGTATFSKNGDKTLLLEEKGFLARRGQRFEASRKWHWEIETDDRVRVLFHDQESRLYHDLMFQKEAGTWHATAEHLCSEDLYKGSYRLHPDSIEIQQWIKGPAKDMTLQSHYTRI